MVTPNNLGPDLNGKAVNETQYRGMIISLMYLTTSRPIFNSLLVFVHDIKHILGFDIKGYSDSDYDGCNMDRKSTSGASAAGCCANILWMKSQLIMYDIIYEKVPIFYDNISTIAISNNPVLHSRTKHIDIRFHFIRDHILKGDIELHFIPTQYQLADIFTKPLDEPTFKRLICELGGKTGGFDKILNKDAIILYCLANGVETDFANKANAPMAFKDPKPSSKAKKKITQGTKPEVKSRRGKKQILFTYNHPQSKPDTTKASTIIHSESASRHDASANLTAKVDLGKYAFNDSISKQQDMN
ncbi:hypothetical protein Tco_1098250 [Tanacetum coccineum]